MSHTDPPSTCSPIETQLREIYDRIDIQEWTIEDLFNALKGKGYPFLMVLLSLPFCQPIPLPGLSTPFGIVLIFIGLRMAFGSHIWWPQWVLHQKVSHQTLKIVIEKSLWFLKLLKHVLHARWCLLSTDSFLYSLHGIFTAFMGVYLALPLPIPFTNMLAAWSLLFIGLGLIEDDGLFICIGYAIGYIGVLVLGLLIIFLRHLIIA